MKRTHLYFIISILLALFTFVISSCSDDDKIEVIKMTIEIDSEPVIFYDVVTKEEPGMWVREEGKKNWEKWPQKRIKGFSFEEGYYTKLQIIKKFDHRQEGQNGGSPISYQLQKILEKIPSESIRNK